MRSFNSNSMRSSSRNRVSSRNSLSGTFGRNKEEDDFDNKSTRFSSRRLGSSPKSTSRSSGRRNSSSLRLNNKSSIGRNSSNEDRGASNFSRSFSKSRASKSSSRRGMSSTKDNNAMHSVSGRTPARRDSNLRKNSFSRNSGFSSMQMSRPSNQGIRGSFSSSQMSGPSNQGMRNTFSQHPVSMGKFSQQGIMGGFSSMGKPMMMGSSRIGASFNSGFAKQNQGGNNFMKPNSFGGAFANRGIIGRY